MTNTIRSRDPRPSDAKPFQGRCDAAIVRAQVSQVASALGYIYGWKVCVDDAAISKRVSLYPPTLASREVVAIHEVGHFVADEREGLIAATASIERSSHHEWTGKARCWNVLWLRPMYAPHDPEDFCRNARAILAGPIAEELIGGGKSFGRFTELVRARVHSDRAAEFRDEFSGAVWIEIVREAVAIVELYRPQIIDLATILAKRREITRNSRGVPQILKTVVPRASVGTKTLSAKGEALARRIIAETPCVAEFLNMGSAE